MELRYIGRNQPYGMIVDVDEKDVERLLDSGSYERIIPKFINPKKEVKHGSNISRSKSRY